MAPPPTVVWRAPRDGQAHAYHRTGRRPALCGVAWLDERWQWPTQTKCPACLAKVDELTRAALRGPAAQELGL